MKQIQPFPDPDPKLPLPSGKGLGRGLECRGALATRYIAKAGDQETRLEQLTKDKQAAGSERTRLQEELETMIRNLTVDRLLTQRKAP
jgi:hypothetical protein